jgi:hypothetical protein
MYFVTVSGGEYPVLLVLMYLLINMMDDDGSHLMLHCILEVCQTAILSFRDICHFQPILAIHAYEVVTLAANPGHTCVDRSCPSHRLLNRV